jgi:hypothetical protein
MKKIPTIFERDWDGDRSRVLPIPVAEADWVFAGEGVATRKYDGTACLIRDGQMFKRHEVREGKTSPEGFEVADHDGETGKTVGWVPVGDGPEDRWHREGLANSFPDGDAPDGTYELVGPKVQGNPEDYPDHVLIMHAKATPYIVPRDYDGMHDLLAAMDCEGFVFHHPDGRMAKIKKRDFGLKRRESVAA